VFFSSLILLISCNRASQSIDQALTPTFERAGDEVPSIALFIDYLSPIGIMTIIVPVSLCIGFATLSKSKACVGTSILYCIGMLLVFLVGALVILASAFGETLSGPRDITLFRYLVNALYIYFSAFLVFKSFCKLRNIKNLKE